MSINIIKHIIYEERIRKQMYNNHECTALELEGRCFNEKILKLADRIAELEAENEKYGLGMQENCQLRKRIDELEDILEDALKSFTATQGNVSYSLGHWSVRAKAALQGEKEWDMNLTKSV